MTEQIKTHASRADALSHLAAEDCKSAKVLFDNSRWRESAIFSLQSMEKYISSASESIPVRQANRSESDVHSLDQALAELADKITRYNQVLDNDSKSESTLLAAVESIRKNVLEDFDFHKMHNWLRYPRWHKELNSHTNFEADERLASALMAKISCLCVYINDIKKFCITLPHR
jgi:HEPN domain-containing protein